MYYLYLVYYKYCLNNLISLNFNITNIEIHILYTYQVLLENNIFTAVKVKKVLLRIKLVLQPILIMYIYQTGMPNVGIVVRLVVLRQNVRKRNEKSRKKMLERTTRRSRLFGSFCWIRRLCWTGIYFCVCMPKIWY